MGQTNDNGFTVKDDGTIVRNPSSSKVDEMKRKISSGGNGGNSKPSNDNNNSNTWIILLIAIGVIVGGIILLNSDNDTYSDTSYTPSANEEITPNEVAIQEAPKEIEEKFATNRYSKSTNNSSDKWSLKMEIDYPTSTSGKGVFVSEIRNWINRTLRNITNVPRYDYDMDDGNRLVNYYFTEVLNNMNDEIHRKIELFKEYETDKFVTFDFYHEYYAEGAHGNEEGGGATFRKSDGGVINWGMFINDSKMQELIRAGLDRYFDGTFDVDATPLPKGYPILLANGVKFVYERYEIDGTSYANGRPQFIIPYRDIKYNMNSDLRELID